MLAYARRLMFCYPTAYSKLKLNSNSRKSQPVIPKAEAPGITLTRSSIKSRNVVAGLMLPSSKEGIDKLNIKYQVYKEINVHIILSLILVLSLFSMSIPVSVVACGSKEVIGLAY